MKIRNFIISLAVLFTFVGCFKDKGNYNYALLPDIRLRLQEHPAITVGEKVTFIPTLILPKDYASTFTYEWSLNSKPVSTEEKYEFKATEIGTPQIGLTVTDTKTGSKYFQKAAQNVDARFAIGFLILTEDGENTDMHFLRSTKVKGDKTIGSNDSLIFKEADLNIYKNFINEEIVGKPARMTEHWTWETGGDGELTVETIVDGKSKFIEINGTTMKRETYIEQEFTANGLPDNFAPKQITHSCWDSFILNEDGYIYPRRVATSSSYHTGYFDKIIKLWGDAKFSDLFFCHYGNSNMFLAVELDKTTQQRNFVGIYENIGSSSSFETLSSKKLPQNPIHPDFVNIKEDFLFDDYFHTRTYAYDGMHAFILKNESNEYILHLAEFSNISGMYVEFFRSTKINLTTQHDITKVKGLITSKTEYDRIAYFYDDNTIHYYDANEDQYGTLINYSGKMIVAAAGHSLNLSRYNSNSDKREIEAHIMVGFSDGTVEILELDNLDPTKVVKKAYESDVNFGPIKQIIYKVGTDIHFSNY